MSEKKSLYFELLGSFSYGNLKRAEKNESGHEEKSEQIGENDSTLKAGRKTLSFLQYLIVYHERNLSSEELIEEFWPEQSNDPGNALRRMLFKVRNILKAMFPEYDNLLLTLSGGYAWSPDICLKLDIKQFEEVCMEAGKRSGEERLKFLLLAVSLYKGDFLPSNDNEWAIGLRQYYRALYLDACKEALPLLGKKENWLEILSICERACKIDFAEEDFTAYAMQALIAMGQREQAIEKYEAFRVKMFQEFGISPSGQVEQLYILATGLIKKEMGFKLLHKESEERTAFFCTFETFQSIVTLERRHLARSKGQSSLVIVSLDGGEVSTTDVRRLERVLLEGLRAGDPIARLEVGSYVLMLTGADEESAWSVMGRLDRMFHKTYWRSKAHITYHVSMLSAEENKKEPPTLSKK